MTDKFPRVAIVGSRDFARPELVERFVYLLPKDWTVISGGARGVDRWAEQTARYWNRHLVIYKADWVNHGKSAGFVRNNKIVRNCDCVVAFWDGSSRGTKHTIQLSAYLKKPCIIISTY